MSVAIAVPALDQGRFLAAALESVFAQTGVELQVAVLDGGSRDGSIEVIRRFESRLAYWRSAPDAGQAAAINEGLSRLRGTDYVGWLNADDLLLPSALETMHAYLDAHPESVAVFGDAHVVDETGHVIGRFPTRPFSRRRLAKRSIVCQPASLIRRSAWDAVAGLDESLHLCLDYDLWWRLSRVGPIGSVPEVLACSRDHDLAKTRARHDRVYEEAFAVLRRHLGYVPWPWCVSEAAYAWRKSHRGERAKGPASWVVCGWRALGHYARLGPLSFRARGLTTQ